MNWHNEKIKHFQALHLAAVEMGEDKLAAHQISVQLWLFAAFFIDGVAITANSLGSKLVASGQKAEARELFDYFIQIGFYIGVGFGFTYFFAKSFIISIFTTDPNVIKELNEVWLLLVLAQCSGGMVYVYDGIILAYQEFRFARRQMLGGLLVCVLPTLGLSLFVYKSYWGVWLALVLLNLYRLVTSYFKFSAR